MKVVTSKHFEEIFGASCNFCVTQKLKHEMCI